MARKSAGLIPFTIVDGKYMFFVGHPGGPYWGDIEYWALLKGRVERNEEIEDTAIREFKEESGAKLLYDNVKKNMRFVGEVTQRSGKVVVAYALKMASSELINPSECFSNMVYGCDWPEVDAYKWVPYDEIVKCTNPANISFYEKIVNDDSLGLYKNMVYGDNNEC